MQVTTTSLEKFVAEATRFTKSLHERQSGGALVVNLSGDLGAGKTTFVQVMARELGVQESVTSPTFVIEKIYQIPITKDGPRYFRRLIHIDAYRLKEARELEVLGWNELIAEQSNLILIEWPENVSVLGAIKISIEYIDENTRKLTFE